MCVSKTPSYQAGGVHCVSLILIIFVIKSHRILFILQLYVYGSGKV